MKDHTMILILVIAFFVLGCNFSCKGMKENYMGELTMCNPDGNCSNKACCEVDSRCDGVNNCTR
jgi:hypothetical protein